MDGTYAIDASVILNAFNPYEAGHTESLRLLARMQAQAVPIIVPTLLLPEAAAAVSRGRPDDELAREFSAGLRHLSHVVWVPLDAILAMQASGVAARYRLRGSDAVYAAVALRFGSALVTLDQEQRERVEAALKTWHPAELLAEVDVR